MLGTDSTSWLKYKHLAYAWIFISLPNLVFSSDTQGTASDTQTDSAKGDTCDESLPLRSSLYVTPTDAPDSIYTINFGTYTTQAGTSTTVKILDKRQINFEILELRDEKCKPYYVIFHGEFSSKKRAENEMWRLLSFPNPAPFGNKRLLGSIVKKPPTPDDS